MNNPFPLESKRWHLWQNRRWRECWMQIHHPEEQKVQVETVVRNVAACRFRGEPTGETRQCQSCKGVVKLKVLDCDVYGTCTVEKPVDGIPGCCRNCTAKMSLEIVRLDQGGIGDTFLAIAAAYGLGPHVLFDPPPDRSEWASLFMRLAPKKQTGAKLHIIKLDDYDRVFKRAGARWEWFTLVVGAMPVLPKLLPLPQDILGWALPYAGRIVIAPHAGHGHDNREWPLKKWVEVNRHLNETGYRTLVIGNRGPGILSVFDHPLTATLDNASPQRVAAIMQWASAFCGNDSGMAHLAGMLGVQGVAVCTKASDPNIFGLYPTLTQLGDDCATPADVALALKPRPVIDIGDGAVVLTDAAKDVECEFPCLPSTVYYACDSRLIERNRRDFPPKTNHVLIPAGVVS